MKKIVFPVVLLFGILLISTIGVSTATACKEKENAVVITPPEEQPSHNAGGNGVERACIHVPWIAILRSPAIQPLKYTLTISVNNPAYGTTDPAPGTYVYYAHTCAPHACCACEHVCCACTRTVVTVTAIPYAGYTFDHWELDGADNSVKPINVLMDADHDLLAVFVVAAKPAIGLSPTSLTFSTVVGSNPLSQTVTVTNTGPAGSTLNWSATDDAAWLSESPTAGSLGSGASADTTVSIDITGLTVGTYNATITVSDPNATNNPQTVSVTLEVRPGE